MTPTPLWKARDSKFIGRSASMTGSLPVVTVQLYNAYVECQTQLQLEKQETKRVSRVLDEIVQEVESKAPVLKRQREEYESMQRSMTSLCNKLEQARTVWTPSPSPPLVAACVESYFLLTVVRLCFLRPSGDLQLAKRERGGQAALRQFAEGKGQDGETAGGHFLPGTHTQHAVSVQCLCDAVGGASNRPLLNPGILF